MIQAEAAANTTTATTSAKRWEASSATSDTTARVRSVIGTARTTKTTSVRWRKRNATGTLIRVSARFEALPALGYNSRRPAPVAELVYAAV